MDFGHLHLLINHLPVFGSILGSLVLIIGIYKKSETTIIASYLLLILAAFGAFVAFLTGEPAEDAIEKIGGISENAIELHEDFAFITLIILIVLGLVSFVGWFLIVKKMEIARVTSFIILFVAIGSFILAARTAYLGGKIRHTEFNSNSTTTIETDEVESEEGEVYERLNQFLN